MSAGIPKQIPIPNVTTTVSHIELGCVTQRLTIINTHASNTLYLSFDAQNWITLKPAGGQYDDDITRTWIELKASASGTTVECVAVV